MQQENGSDCGVFAIAFAKSLLSGIDPTKLQNSRIPEFSSVPTKRFPEVQHKTVFHRLKPVTRDTEEYEVDILS